MKAPLEFGIVDLRLAGLCIHLNLGSTGLGFRVV